MSSFDHMKEAEHDYEYREYLKSKNSPNSSGCSGCVTTLLGTVFLFSVLIFTLLRGLF